MYVKKDFYELLSDLFKQIAQNPDEPPRVPINEWPVESEERRLLEDLESALTAIQSQGRDTLTGTDARERLYRAIFENARDGLILHDIETGQVVDANPEACRMYGYTRDEFIGQLSFILIPPERILQFEKYIQEVQAVGAAIALQANLRKDGSLFSTELSGSLFTTGARSFILSVVRDVSQRVKGEQMLQQRVEERTREQSTLLEISQTLASALELQPHLILDQMRVIIDYTHAGLFKLEDSTMVVLAVRGPKALERAMPFQILLKSPDALTELYNKRRPTRISDVQSPDPASRFLRSLLDEQAALLLQGVHSWMWVPLAIKDRMIGVIGLAHTERSYFTAHHADLALTVANQAAITMANAELYENAQALAALEERQRLARNLHDAVNQSLFSAGLIAEVLPRLWERDPAEGRKSLEDLRRLTRGAQADMRLLLAELRPSTLTDAELGDLLRLLGNALTGRTNIPIEVTVTGDGKLPTEVQVILYRLCQEGLNNIAKHAGASRVDILLQYVPSGIELRIRDDGRGFDPQKALPGHYGLSMMHERAAAIGATLSISSQPGIGTKIFIGWVKSEEQKDG
jgi:PAS domain S-box-containing protein